MGWFTCIHFVLESASFFCIHSLNIFILNWRFHFDNHRYQVCRTIAPGPPEYKFARNSSNNSVFWHTTNHVSQ